MFSMIFVSFQENEINDIDRKTSFIESECQRLENEAQELLEKNFQFQIEQRLLRDKYVNCKKIQTFQQLKSQIQSQRRSFKIFERRLRDKYQQPLQIILSQYQKTMSTNNWIDLLFVFVFFLCVDNKFFNLANYCLSFFFLFLFASKPRSIFN